MKNKVGRLSGVTNLILGIVSLLVGIILIINPKFTLTGLCSVVGTVLLVLGVIMTILYFGKGDYKDFSSSGFTINITIFLAGLLILIRKESISSFFPQFLAIYIMISGVMKMQQSMDLLGMKDSSWSMHFLLGLIVVILSGVVLIWPEAGLFTAKDRVPMYICILLIADGLLSIISLFHSTMCKKKFQKAHPEMFEVMIDERQDD